MDCISLILFSLPCPNSSDVMCLKSLYSKSVTITIIILSQVCLFGVTADLSRLTSTQTSENTLETNESNSFSLLIFEYINSSCSIKYTTPIPIWEHMALSLSHICYGSSLSIILLNKLLLTLPCIISVAIPIVIWSSFLLWSQRISSFQSCWSPTETMSQMSFETSMALVKVAHRGQFEKPISFFLILVLGPNKSALTEFMLLFLISIFRSL